MQRCLGATGATLALLLAGSAAFAQTAPPSPQAASADTGENSGQIEDIVVTARRVAESAQRVPVAITVLGAGALKDASVRGVRDLQGAAPALFISSGAGGPTAANIAIRGQSQADVLLVTDPSVAVYVNEVNLPRQVGLRAAFLDVDQIEVLKGSQGTLFGKNTTGGALLIRSKRPDLSAVGGYADLSMGNLGFYQIDAALSVPLIDDKLAIRIAGEDLSRNGIGHNVKQRLGAQNNQSARASLLFQPNDGVKLFVTGDYTHATSTGSVINATFLDPLEFNAAGQPISSYASSLPAVLREVAVELGLPLTTAGYTQAYNTLSDQLFNKNGFFNTNGTYPVSSFLELYGGSADLSVDVTDGITLRSITGYRGTRRNDVQDYDQTRFLLSKPNNYVYSHQFSEEFQVVHNGGGRFTWIAGLFYSHEAGREGSVTVALPAISAASPATTDYSVTNNSYAGFAQANYAITDKLKLTGGIRYTKITQDVVSRNHNPLGCLVPVPARPDPAVCSANFGTGSKRPSYLASLNYQATPDIMVYAKTSSSFRGGGINVRGASATSTAPFAPFGPEKATDYELGFKGELLDRHLRINAAAYYTDYNGIQRSTLSPGINNTLITILTSSAKGRIYGGELEMTYRPSRALTLNASGNWTHTGYTKFIDAAGHDRSNEAFPVPEFQYMVSGKYTLPLANHDLSLFASYNWQSKVNYRAESLFDQGLIQKAFGLLDGRIAYDINGDPNVQLAFYGKNLLNKHYYTNGLNFDNSLGFDVGFAGDPRTFGVELRVALGGG